MENFEFNEKELSELKLDACLEEYLFSDNICSGRMI